MNKEKIKQTQNEIKQPKTMTKKEADSIIKAERKAIRAEEFKAQQAIKEKAAKESEIKKTVELSEKMKDPKEMQGLLKQATNAEKTSANAAKREAQKLQSKPGYKRAYAKMQNYSDGKLQNVINNSKNTFEVAAAKNLLLKSAK